MSELAFLLCGAAILVAMAIGAEAAVCVALFVAAGVVLAKVG